MGKNTNDKSKKETEEDNRIKKNKSKEELKRLQVKSKTSKNISYILVLILTLIIFILLISIILIVLAVKTASQEKEYIEKIVDMQSNTLAVTGIAVTLVSLVTVFLNYNRDQGIKELENELKSKINDVDNVTKLLEENFKILSSASLNSTMHFSLKDNSLRAIDPSLNNKNILIVLLQLYEERLSVIKGDKEKEILYERKINPVTEKILKKENLDDYDKHVVWASKGSSSLFLGRTKSEKYPSDAKMHLLEAEHYFLELYKLCQVNEEENAYLYNSLGLTYYWLYKIECDLSNDEKQAENIKKFINNSKEYYKKAISAISPNTATYINNYAVVLLNEAGRTIDCNESQNLLDDALKLFIKSAKLNPFNSKYYLNIANVYIQKARNILGLNVNPMLLSKYINEFKVSPEHEITINKYFGEAEKMLEISSKHDPLFINNYYKTAQLKTYQLFFLMCKNVPDGQKILKESIETCFKNADEIDKKSLGNLYIQRNYYELIGDREKARLINVIIGNENHSNSDAWNKLIREEST